MAHRSRDIRRARLDKDRRRFDHLTGSPAMRSALDAVESYGRCTATLDLTDYLAALDARAEADRTRTAR